MCVDGLCVFRLLKNLTTKELQSSGGNTNAPVISARGLEGDGFGNGEVGSFTRQSASHVQRGTLMVWTGGRTVPVLFPAVFINR